MHHCLTWLFSFGFLFIDRLYFLSHECPAGPQGGICRICESFSTMLHILFESLSGKHLLISVLESEQRNVFKSIHFSLSNAWAVFHKFDRLYFYCPSILCIFFKNTFMFFFFVLVLAIGMFSKKLDFFERCIVRA